VKTTPSRNSTRTVPPSPTIGDARVQGTPGITQRAHRARRVVLHVGKRRCLNAPPAALGVQTSVVAGYRGGCNEAVARGTAKIVVRGDLCKPAGQTTCPRSPPI
jgi:hypothetical protein